MDGKLDKSGKNMTKKKLLENSSGNNLKDEGN